MSKETITINGQKHEIETKPVTIICQNGDLRIEYNRMELSDHDTIYHIEKCMRLHPKIMRFYHIVFPDFLKGCSTEERDGETWVVADENLVGCYSRWFLKNKTTGKLEMRFNDFIGSEGHGSKHVFGLIDLTLKLTDNGVPVAWIHPESHLHPSVQANLADLIIALREEYKTDAERLAEHINQIKQDIGYKGKKKTDPPELNLDQPL